MKNSSYLKVVGDIEQNDDCTIKVKENSTLKYDRIDFHSSPLISFRLSRTQFNFLSIPHMYLAIEKLVRWASVVGTIFVERDFLILLLKVHEIFGTSPMNINQQRKCRPSLIIFLTVVVLLTTEIVQNWTPYLNFVLFFWFLVGSSGLFTDH